MTGYLGAPPRIHNGLPRSYVEAAAYLGRKSDRPIGGSRNTRIIRRSASAVAIRLHHTDVVTFNADGSALLDNGGWSTMTTHARMAACGFQVYGLSGSLYCAPYGAVPLIGPAHRRLLILPDGVAVEPDTLCPVMPEEPPAGEYCADATSGRWAMTPDSRARRRRQLAAIRALDFAAFLADTEPAWRDRIAGLQRSYAARLQKAEAVA